MPTVNEVLTRRDSLDATTLPVARAVSWAAILGGAVSAAALSLILLALGSGLGLSSVSPWAYDGASAKTIGIAGAVWLLLMAGIASGLGGYLAGRLREKWTDIDSDEAFFRDTAHGFLAWGVATLFSAAILASAASSMVGTAAKAAAGAGVAAAGTAAAGTAAAGAGTGTATSNASDSSGDYFTDLLFRGSKPAEAGVDMTDMRREVGGILAHSATGDVSQADRTYLSQVVAERTGLSAADADQRVAQTVGAAKAAADTAATKAREAADAARKASAYLALWVFVSLLFGAFCAAFAATLGGKQRDALVYRRAAI